MIYIKEYEPGEEGGRCTFTAYHKYFPLIGRGYDPREAFESLAACIAAYVDAYEWQPGDSLEQRDDRWVAHSRSYGFTVYAKTYSDVKYKYILTTGIREFRDSLKQQELWQSIINEEVV